ncbi:MAG: 4-(cytidine 5'-diphospho)-2-C-methyl-D-erythritol kinase, partial [Candidatus Omnitrophica bacterium]|nr:4-(cytidine 5'-diphospho)-2-C-methyl-D-erythritol kinase [Candidatus Omnitrophota bacterium]
MGSIVLKAPAKVNLYLDVLKKRPDGYHDIETIFERIALFDTIIIKNSPDKKIRVTSDHPGLPLGRDNLVYKAAEAIFKKAGLKVGVCVDIKKRIPVAAGLAGGSSDAASMLIGINRLFRLGLSKAQLAGLARAIGADVAFFLYDCSFAIGTGRGDQIKPLPINDASIWHIIIPFNFGISAHSAYNGISRNLR